MRVFIPLGSGAGAVIIEVTAAITAPGNVDVVPLVILCVTSFIVTASLVALVQWYESKRARRAEAWRAWDWRMVRGRFRDLEEAAFGHVDPGHQDERGDD